MGFIIYYSLSNGVNGYYKSRMEEDQLGEYSKACVELAKEACDAEKFPSKKVAKDNAKFIKSVVDKASNKKTNAPFVVSMQIMKESN